MLQSLEKAKIIKINIESTCNPNILKTFKERVLHKVKISFWQISLKLEANQFVLEKKSFWEKQK